MSHGRELLNRHCNRYVLGLALIGLMMIATWPIWAYPIPPLGDYANHLTRMHIVASLPSDPDLARYYRVDWQVIPNLAMDLIVPPLSTLIGLNAAGQVFLTAIFGTIAIGMMLLGRSLFGRWSAAPLFGLPFLYNGMLLIGCLNYLLGVGLALCALAAWVALETKSLWIKLGLAGAMVIPLFFCHLYSVGLFCVGLLAFELLKQSNARRWTWARRAREFFVPAIAFLPVLPLLLASPTADLSGNIIWDMHDKSSGFTLALVTYSGWIGAVLFAALVVAAFLAVWLGLLSAHPVTPFLLFTGITIYFLMPRELFDTCMTDQRMPIALLFMLLATIDLRLPKQAWGAVIGIAAVFLGIRVVEINSHWRTEANEIADVQKSFTRLRRGAKVLVATADPTRGYTAGDFGLVHAVSLASVSRSALTTRTFAVSGKQILQVKDAYKDLVDQYDVAPPDIDMLKKFKKQNGPNPRVYWHHWPVRYDYLYVLFTDKQFASPDPNALKLIYAGDRFRLFAMQSGSPPSIVRPNIIASRRRG